MLSEVKGTILPRISYRYLFVPKDKYINVVSENAFTNF